MATIEKPQVFEAPGRPGSPVEVAERYENFIGGDFVPPSKGLYRANLSPVDGEAVCLVAASTPEDIAASTVFLASRASRHVTGETLLIDAGSHLGFAPLIAR